MKSDKLPIKHVGIHRALCNEKLRAELRPDLGAERYRQLGVSERFKNEDPYRICKNCIRLADKWHVVELRRKHRRLSRTVGGNS